MSDPRRWHRTAWLRGAIVVLSIAAAIWLPYQIWRLVLSEHPVWPTSPEGAVDLRMRADEATRWFSGQPVYGAIASAVYLPASLLMLWPLVAWLPFVLVRWLWGAIECASLAWLTAMVMRESRSRTRLELVFAGLLPLALYPSGASIGNGQLTIPALALAIAALLRLRDADGSWRADLVTSGLFLLALVKPDVTAPFVWILLIRARSARPAMLVGAGYLLMTVAAFWSRGLGDVPALKSVLLGRLLWGAGLQFGGLSASFEAGKALILSAGILGLLVFCVWSYRHRRDDIWPTLGVLAVMTRLGFYHHWYDDLLILIPMVALLRLGRDEQVSAPRRRAAGVLLATMIVLMIAPGGVFLLPPLLSRVYVAAQVTSWMAALVFLVDHMRRLKSSTASVPIATPPGEFSVRDVSVMSSRDRKIYVAWMVVWTGFLMAISIEWFRIALASRHVLLALLVYPVALRGAAKITFEWYKAFRMRRPEHVPAAPGLRVAMVTTFVPGAEPLAMLETTLAAMTSVRYPHDTYVLDEGDDPLVRAACQRLGVIHFTRNGQQHFNQTGTSGWFPTGLKVGNLNAWLHAVGFDRYDFVAFLDPDHVAEPQLLDRTLGYFRDPRIGYVQAPQIYYNEASGFIARGAAELTYFYYGPYNMAAYGLGAAIIDGCHTTLRIDALRHLGGYSVHAGEDLLLTHKLLEAGVRGVYVPEVLARGLAPESWHAFLRQQQQWAYVTIDIKLWHFARMRHKVKPLARLILLLHGIGYLYSVSAPFGYLLLASILLFWSLPPLSLALMIQLAAVAIVGIAMGLWFQKFHIRPAVERGLFWRANLLGVARWPDILAGVTRALAHRPIRRKVTPKSTAPRVSLRLFRWQVAILVGLALCVVVSFQRHEPSVWPVRLYAMFGISINALLLVSALVTRLRARSAYGPEETASVSSG